MGAIESLNALLDQEDVVLGLDAYGVIYNDQGPFEPLQKVFDFCHYHGIDIYLMTNNATQSTSDIAQKLDRFGLHINEDHVISSGCGCYFLPSVQSLIQNRKVFVYGYPASQFYPMKAGGTIVDDPESADVIVMAASSHINNHQIYKAVHDALIQRPTLPVVCINPDHYVMNAAGLRPVMGYYANLLAHQLDRHDFVWMGKPYPLFSELIQRVLTDHGHLPSNLVFCDDNPYNVAQLSNDLNCQGVVISDTGLASRYPMPKASHLYHLPICCVD